MKIKAPLYSFPQSLSPVWLFVTPRTVARQVPLSMGFSRQEYWSGLPLPSPAQGLNRGLLHCRQILCHLSHQGSSFVSSGCHNKIPQTGWWKQHNYSLTDLEATSPRSGCLQGWFPLKVLRKSLFRAHSHAPGGILGCSPAWEASLISPSNLTHGSQVPRTAPSTAHIQLSIC